MTNDQPANSVTMFDAMTHTVITTMTGSINQPRSVAISPDGRRVYVVNAAAETVSVFDTISHAEVAGSPIATLGGAWPNDMFITPDGTKGYVLSLANSITVIDLATNTVIGTPITSAELDSPGEIALTPDGSTAYVMMTFVGKIAILDIAANTITGSFAPAGLSYPMSGLAISPDGLTAWISSGFNHEVRAIDLTTQITSPPISVGGSPNGLAGPAGGGLHAGRHARLRGQHLGHDGLRNRHRHADGDRHLDRLHHAVRPWREVHRTCCRGAQRQSGDDHQRCGSDHARFGSVVPLQGGTIQLGGAWTTTRTLDLQGTTSIIDTHGFSAVINGDLIDDGTLTKTGTGTLTLAGSNTHTGGTIVSGGTLSVAGTHPATITVNGGTLGGNGTVGSVLVSAGSVAPGNSPGILHATNVTLDAGTTLDIQVDGLTPGTGYDQLDVSGTTTINGATLQITSSITPPSTR